MLPSKVDEADFSLRILRALENAGFPHGYSVTNFYGFVKVIFNMAFITDVKIREAQNILYKESGILWGVCVEPSGETVQVTLRALDSIG